MTPLVDRDNELAIGDAVLAKAHAGEGSLLVVQGLPGSGKTALLKQLARRARCSGCEVLLARGIMSESDYAFGIAGQLLEFRLRDGGASLLDPSWTDPCDPTRVHDLFRVVANLAVQRPVVLVVDDAQWTDDPSLRFLRHLAARLQRQPIVVMIAWRTGFESAGLRALLIDSDVALHLGPFSKWATTDVVRSQLPPADDSVVDACAEVTGGNPFLLAELLTELGRGFRVSLERESVHRTAPRRVAVSTLSLAANIHRNAPDLLHAIAVLGSDAHLCLCAQLAGLDVANARTIANSLAAQGVLTLDDRLAFLYPIVRTSVYANLSQLQRTVLHTGAARLLAARTEAPAVIAEHLLAAGSLSAPGSTTLLRETARRVAADGLPEPAIELLRRALGSIARPSDRYETLLELGVAEYEARHDGAITHLSAAFDNVEDPCLRARALITLVSAKFVEPETQPVDLDVCEQLISDVSDSDPDLALELHAARFGEMLANPVLAEKVAEEVDCYRDLNVRTKAEHLILSFVARAELSHGHLESAADYAERSARHPSFINGRGDPLWRLNVVNCLIEAQRFEVAEDLLSRLIDKPSTARLSLLISLRLRAIARHRRGDLNGAEEDARRVLADQLMGIRPQGELLRAVLVLIEVLVDQGHYDDAAELVDDYQLADHVAGSPGIATVLAIRGRVRAGRGNNREARADLEAALDDPADCPGWELPGTDPRLDLCLVLRATGDDQAACALADTALDAALDTRAGHRVAVALRVAGIVRGGSEGLDLLRKSAHLLADSRMELELAKSLTEYGAALRRSGQLRTAREVLREALQLANRLGAVGLIGRLSEELPAAALRQRKVAFGTESLTASELRVAHLASSGLSNKEIAKSLFVTVRTVELHLSNTFNKLEIRSRREIATALSG